MKKLSLLKSMLLLCALVAGSGSVWAIEAVHYTLYGTQKGGTNGYGEASTITQNGMTWSVMANTKESPWRIGGKGISGADRPVYSTTEMGATISKIDITFGTKTITGSINSVTLIVASNSDFSTQIDQVAIAYAESTTKTITPSAGKTWSSGAYYKFVFNITQSGSSNKYLQLEKIKFYKDVTEVPVTITSAEYATYLTPCALNFSTTGIKAYTATDEETQVTLNEIVSGQVPGNTPVVLYKEGASGAPINVPAIASAEALAGTNDLKLSTGIDVDYMYVLSKKNSKVGFRVWNATDPLSAGKIYLLGKAAYSAREFIEIDGETTGIEKTIINKMQDGQYYNLAGQRIAQPTKGLYIVNGKKVIIK
jgi:hypothetical protein